MTSPLGLDDPNVAISLGDHVSTCKRAIDWRWRFGVTVEAVAAFLAPRFVTLAVGAVVVMAAAEWLMP